MLVTARNFPKEDEVCAWRLHPNTRNQAKGMLEVLRLAHVNSEFESRVSVRPSFRLMSTVAHSRSKRIHPVRESQPWAGENFLPLLGLRWDSFVLKADMRFSMTFAS